MTRGLLIILGLFILSAVPVDAAAQQLELEDGVVQGALVRGRVAPGSSVQVDGKDVPVTEEGWFVFGIGRDRQGSVTLTHVGPKGGTSTHEFPIRERQFNIERVNGLPPKTVTPPKEWLERRRGETARVGKGRAENRPLTHWVGGFILPAEGRFSGFYGSQRILNGKPRSPHYGLDIAAPTGTPVVAPAAGIVTLADGDFLLEGGIVIIDHGYGVTSTLFHMNSVDVDEGQSVKQGEQIGTIGAKGRASGPHVDWRINWGNVRVDPALALPRQLWPEVTANSFKDAQ